MHIENICMCGPNTVSLVSTEHLEHLEHVAVTSSPNLLSNGSTHRLNDEHRHSVTCNQQLPLINCDMHDFIECYVRIDATQALEATIRDEK